MLHLLDDNFNRFEWNHACSKINEQSIVAQIINKQ